MNATNSSNEWDALAGTYHDDIIGPFHPIGGRTSLHDVLDTLLPGSTVLDAGCGVGNLGRYAHARHISTTIHGIDLSQSMLDGATGGGYATLKRADITATGFDDATFDVVVSVNSVIPQPTQDDKRIKVREAFAEFARVCKPGGIVVGVLPSYDSLAEEQAATATSSSNDSHLLLDPHDRLGDTGFGDARCMHDAVTIFREMEPAGLHIVTLTPLQYSMLLSKLHELRTRAWDWLVVTQRR